MINHRVRLATQKDIERLASIDAEVQQLHYEASPGTWLRPDVSRSADFFRQQLADAGTTTVVSGSADGTVVGYALIHVRGEDMSAHRPSRRVVDLHHLGVAREYHRRGHGSALLGWVLRFAADEGADEIVLSVWLFNTGAVSFYERHGFSGISMKMVRRTG